jgi:GT2 family glycosyltransferase
MPVLNEAAAIDATLDSLFAQTRLPDEIVVADGGSSDDTVARVLRHNGRSGVPVRAVANPSRFCGGGRNAATRAARHELMVTMDAGNLAEPTWLEAMVRVFELDPELDLAGGLYYALDRTPFERMSAVIVNFEDFAIPRDGRAQIAALLPKDFVPGGMCMAYRRAIWERAGGFSEWARKGQDRLFGQRVRRLGGKVGCAFDAVVRYHSSGSFRELFDRHLHYGVWSGRMSLPRRRFRHLLAVYAAALALTAAAIVLPALWLLVLALAAVYLWRGAWRKLPVAARALGVSFEPGAYLLAPTVLLARDAAIIAGNLLGSLDRILRPKWRRRTVAYLERGA